MTFKKSEKEIIKTIVKYGGEDDKSLAEMLNASKLLEKKGIAIISQSSRNYVFLDKKHYDYEQSNKALGYIAEIMSLISMLIENRLIVPISFATSFTYEIGVDGFRGIKPDLYTTKAGEIICLADRNVNWFDGNNQQKCWPFCFSEKEMPMNHFFRFPFSVSQELKDMVKNDFKSEEQIRFEKQQFLTWISIGVTAFIGIAGLIVAVLSIIL